MKTVFISSKWDGREVKMQGKKIMGKTVYETALWIENQAKLLCPVRYGWLRASINTQTRDQGTKVESPAKYSKEKMPEKYNVEPFEEVSKPEEDMVAHIGTTVDYGPYMEYGTKLTDAQPFLRPAFDLAMGKSLTLLELNGKTYFKDYLL